MTGSGHHDTPWIIPHILLEPPPRPLTNRSIFAVYSGLEYPMRITSPKPGLPPAFVKSVCMDQLFPVDCYRSNCAQFLIGLDYLDDLEATRRSALHDVALRLGLGIENWRRVVHEEHTTMDWLESTQEKEPKVERYFSKLFLQIRVMAMTVELHSTSFYKSNAVALLNTLFPPNAQLSLRKLVDPLVLGRYRRKFQDAVAALHSDDLADTSALPNSHEIDLMWKRTRRNMHGYFKLSLSMIDYATTIGRYKTCQENTVGAVINQFPVPPKAGKLCDIASAPNQYLPKKIVVGSKTKIASDVKEAHPWKSNDTDKSSDSGASHRTSEQKSQNFEIPTTLSAELSFLLHDPFGSHEDPLALNPKVNQHEMLISPGTSSDTLIAMVDDAITFSRAPNQYKARNEITKSHAMSQTLSPHVMEKVKLENPRSLKKSRSEPNFTPLAPGASSPYYALQNPGLPKGMHEPHQVKKKASGPLLRSLLPWSNASNTKVPKRTISPFKKTKVVSSASFLGGSSTDLNRGPRQKRSYKFTTEAGSQEQASHKEERGSLQFQLSPQDSRHSQINMTDVEHALHERSSPFSLPVSDDETLGNDVVLLDDLPAKQLVEVSGLAEGNIDAEVPHLPIFDRQRKSPRKPKEASNNQDTSASNWQSGIRGFFAWSSKEDSRMLAAKPQANHVNPPILAKSFQCGRDGLSSILQILPEHPVRLGDLSEDWYNYDQSFQRKGSFERPRKAPKPPGTALQT